jgi:hypothetical protein
MENVVLATPPREAEPPKEPVPGPIADTQAATEPESGPLSTVIESVPEPAQIEGPSAASEQGVAPAPPTESTPAESTSPARAVEATPAVAPEPKPEVEAAQQPDVPSSAPASAPSAPAINGHTKSASTASASTAVPTLVSTPSRKTSRKFSFPGRDKSGNASPTGSSRFSTPGKREKRHSLLGKLKEMFSDKDKRERKDKSETA